MREYEPPADGADAADDATGRIVVAVVRTGGLAGLRRRWRVEPEPAQAPQWVALVERCPWDESLDGDGTRGADRYVWSIHARVREQQHEQVIPDALLRGAWRELVDAVRDADALRDADTDADPDTDADSATDADSGAAPDPTGPGAGRGAAPEDDTRPRGDTGAR